MRRVGAGALVYVVEGRVRIEQPSIAALSISPIESPQLSAVELTPGEGATILQDGEVDENVQINITAMSAWRNRRLVFEERPLLEIAEEFSRYVRSPRLIVAGTELHERLYTGSFDADRLDTFVWNETPRWRCGEAGIVLSFERLEGTIKARHAGLSP